jgi:hypothetical protein
MGISQEINNYISIIFLLLNIIVKEIISVILNPQKILMVKIDFIKY